MNFQKKLFVNRTTIDVIRADSLAVGLAIEGLMNDNVEDAIVELHPFQVSEKVKTIVFFQTFIFLIIIGLIILSDFKLFSYSCFSVLYPNFLNCSSLADIFNSVESSFFSHLD